MKQLVCNPRSKEEIEGLFQIGDQGVTLTIDFRPDLLQRASLEQLMSFFF